MEMPLNKRLSLVIVQCTWVAQYYSAKYFHVYLFFDVETTTALTDKRFQNAHVQ